MIVARRVVAFALCALVAGAAAAQQPPPDEAAAAAVEEHLRRGVELRRAGRDDDAVAEFAEAHRLAPGPRTAGQLGLARQAVGAWLDADRLLRECLASPEDPWVSRNRAALESMLAVTATHLGTLEVRANVSGAEVRIDGAVVATTPLDEPLRVLSGVLTLEVSAAGYRTASRRFVVEPGARLRESVELRPAPAREPGVVATSPGAPPPPPPARPPAAPSVGTPREGWRRWAWAPLAVGGVAAALTGVAIGVREDAAVRYNRDRCPPPPPPSPGPCADLAAAASAWEAVAWTAGIAGAAMLIAGGVMLAVPPRRVARGVTLGCAPTGLGAACALSF